MGDKGALPSDVPVAPAATNAATRVPSLGSPRTLNLVQFTFAISPYYKPEDAGFHVLQKGANETNFPDNFENLCLQQNLYGNTNISDITCGYSEKCPDGCVCRNKTTDQTCQSKTDSGSACQGVAVQWKGCDIFGIGSLLGSIATVDCGKPTRSAWWQSYCFKPSPTFYYPIPMQGPDFVGKNNEYYIFRTTYDASQFTTPAHVTALTKVVTENDLNCSEQDRQNNRSNLDKISRIVCNKADTSLTTGSCASYCSISSGSGLPSSNCASGWTGFCQSDDQFLNNPKCRAWCKTVAGESNCKTKLLDYCNNASTFHTDVCTDFYKNSYQNNQITSDASAILRTQCAAVMDKATLEIDPAYTACGCFLPDATYDKFYQRIFRDNPSLEGILSNPQCTYPKCASTSAVHPQLNFTCPNNTLTTCISKFDANNITNSQINIVNSCIASSSITNSDGTSPPNNNPTGGTDNNPTDGTDNNPTGGTDKRAQLSSLAIGGIIGGLLAAFIAFVLAYIFIRRARSKT